MAIVGRIQAERIVIVLRGDYLQSILALAETLLAQQLSVIEITLNSPHALAMIRLLADRFQDQILIGAGTVISVEQVHEAVQAGAKFIVSPDTFPPVITAARDLGVEPIPGAFTPTEIMQGYRHGAKMVKVFPVSVGGHHYIKTIAAPLDCVDLLAMGSIGFDNALDYLNAGAKALGVGSVIVPSSFDGSPSALQAVADRARQLRALVKALPLSATKS